MNYNQEWALVALENGAIRAGRISEEYLLGKRIIRFRLPEELNSYTNEFYFYDDIKGIRISSEEEIQAVKDLSTNSVNS